MGINIDTRNVTIPVGKTAGEHLCIGRIGAGRISRAVDALMVVFRQFLVLRIGNGPEGDEGVDIIIDTFHRILVDIPFAEHMRVRRADRHAAEHEHIVRRCMGKKMRINGPAQRTNIAAIGRDQRLFDQRLAIL